MTITRTIEATTTAGHHVPAMICLEYLPTPRSTKWRVAFRMHEAGRANMEAEAEALTRQEGWHDWRIVDEVIVQPFTFSSELTPEGEQAVIPGCERNLSPKATQLDLF